MQPESQRSIILGAVLAGAAYSWTVPALISALLHPLPVLVTGLWSAIVAIGSYLIVNVNGLDKPRRDRRP